MKTWKAAAAAAVVCGVCAAGAAFVPVAHGQVATTLVQGAPRAVEILGRGSQIGVSVRDVDEEDVKSAKLTSLAGIAISDIVPESPAEKAGLKTGDIVTEFDGEKVRSVRQFVRLVQETPAGRKVTVALLRSGQRSTVTLEPREGDGFRLLNNLRDSDFESFSRKFAVPARPVPPVPPAAPVPPAFPDIESFIWRTGSTLGVTVGDLPAQLAEYFGTKDGVLVTSVAADSSAAKAGLKAGDVITSFNGTTIATPSELRRRIQRLEDGDELTIAVVRDKKALTLKGKVEPRRDTRRTVRSIV